MRLELNDSPKKRNTVSVASGRRVVPPARALIRVSGQYAREARGAEVARGEGADGAGQGACYVLREGARVWVWCAASATGDEREVAKNMAAADHTLVMQGIAYTLDIKSRTHYTHSTMIVQGTSDEREVAKNMATADTSTCWIFNHKHTIA